MNWIEYDESKNLIYNTELKVNQRVERPKTPDGEYTNFCVKNNDIVLFQRTLETDEINKEHKLVVILREDLFDRNPYGEFVLNNSQVEKI